MPELEGLPEFHAKTGTRISTGYVAVSTEGKPTLVEGQAPADMDRYKAWYMDPRYHTISHVRPTPYVSTFAYIDVVACWGGWACVSDAGSRCLVC